MRLDKYLAKSLNISRSEIPSFIKKNEILVNEKKVIKKDYKIDEDKDIIMVNGKKCEYHEFVYYMLNKPKDVVSAVKDNICKTVVDLIDTDYDIFPIGRLDKDTVGLLILTNNGSLSHFLTSPSHHIDKTYLVHTDKAITLDDIEKMKKGIEINDGDNQKYITLPCKVEKINELEYLITLHEGKFHQVKRMFAYFKAEVTYLKRTSFGKIKLDESLEEGKWRYLSDQEIKILKEEFNEHQ